MLMPDKHIRWQESLLGFSSYILECLAVPQSVDDLWERYQLDLEHGRYVANQSFGNLVLALDVLFAVGAIDISPDDFDGVLRRYA
jgi:hypothetical protein